MKKTQKGFAVPLIIAIIAVLAIGGGVYFYVQNKKQSNNNKTGSIPAKIGECSKTKVSEIGTRLEGIAGSGSFIKYTNGIIQVSYNAVKGIEDSLVGDIVNLCLLSIPTNCPSGDVRGKTYSGKNLRSGESWQASDSEHSCGGA